MERRSLVEETSDLSELVERVAALDLGKASLTACVRVPHPAKPGRRCQEVREYGTTTVALLALAGDLRGHGVTLVAMEATSDYWKPVFYLLEAEGFTCWLLNARHVKNVWRGPSVITSMPSTMLRMRKSPQMAVLMMPSVR